MNSIQLKEQLRYHCSGHGNPITLARIIWLIFNVRRKSHAKYELNASKNKGLIEVSLQCHGNLHGNLVAVAMKYAADAYCVKEA